MADHYRVLGLARFDAPWFQAVGTWASTSAIPAEFTRCVSLNEVRARLSTGSPPSCVLVAASVRGIDRDFVSLADEHGATVVIVDDVGDRRPWLDIGVAEVVGPELSRGQLVDLLNAHGTPVTGVRSAAGPDPSTVRSRAVGRLIAVTGSGGTGTSTCAIAVAQSLASATTLRGAHGVVRGGPEVVLADCKFSGEQAMLHNSAAAAPTIQDVVEAHRTATPEPSEVTEQTFEVAQRGYRLLLGLRHRHHWALLQERAVIAAIASLRTAFDVVVADVESDLESDRPSGSSDIANRNVLARSIVAEADSLVVVIHPTMKGLYSGVRLIAELAAAGVAVPALVPMVNQAPRQPHRRVPLLRAFRQLVQMCAGSIPELVDLQRPVLLPRVNIETSLRDGTMLPARFAVPVGKSLTRPSRSLRANHEGRDAAPTRVVPGELAHARVGGDL